MTILWKIIAYRIKQGVAMKVEDFNYELPEELIAQVPIKKRDTSRLMILDRKEQTIDSSKIFSNVIDYLNEGDCLVINNTKVIPARLYGKKETGANVEFLLLKRIEGELCRKCGIPKDICSCKNKRKKSEYKAFIAPFYYENSISAGANRFKDYGYPELAKAMGKEMSEHIEDYFGDVEFDFITFVPMTKKKQNKRGYNQSELLANEISEILDIDNYKEEF